jgi:hypothetical protein
VLYQLSPWNPKILVGSRVLTAASMKMSVLWLAPPCSMVQIYRRFRGTFCHHQGDKCPDDGGSEILAVRRRLTLRDHSTEPNTVSTPQKEQQVLGRNSSGRLTSTSPHTQRPPRDTGNRWLPEKRYKLLSSCTPHGVVTLTLCTGNMAYFLPDRPLSDVSLHDTRRCLTQFKCLRCTQYPIVSHKLLCCSQGSCNGP